jgi:hypothetical protein
LVSLDVVVNHPGCDRAVAPVLSYSRRTATVNV